MTNLYNSYQGLSFLKRQIKYIRYFYEVQAHYLPRRYNFVSWSLFPTCLLNSLFSRGIVFGRRVSDVIPAIMKYLPVRSARRCMCWKERAPSRGYHLDMVSTAIHTNENVQEKDVTVTDRKNVPCKGKRWDILSTAICQKGEPAIQGNDWNQPLKPW